MIDLYTAATPNGYKASIMLEECGLPYEPHFLDLAAEDQKQPDFLKLNPNGRIPAIVDRDEDFAVFESGAILIYLAEKSGKFLRTEKHARSRTIQWLFWQNAGLGPMMGQLNVFRRYFPEHIPAAIDRYERETYRLFGVLDGQLRDNAYVAGPDYTIADMACWPWARRYEASGLSVEAYPALKAWIARIAERPAVQRAIQVPPPRPDDAKMAAAGRKLLV